MSIEFNDNYTKELAKQLADNLEKAALYFKGAVKEAVNRDELYKRSIGSQGVYYKGLDPSEPGEAPKKITGFLQRSIAYEMNADRTAAFVGTGVDYGLYLELGTVKMEPRPYLRSTLLQEQETIAKIVATGHR